MDNIERCRLKMFLSPCSASECHVGFRCVSGSFDSALPGASADVARWHDRPPGGDEKPADPQATSL